MTPLGHVFVTSVFEGFSHMVCVKHIGGLLLELCTQQTDEDL